MSSAPWLARLASLAEPAGHSTPAQRAKIQSGGHLPNNQQRVITRCRDVGWAVGRGPKPLTGRPWPPPQWLGRPDETSSQQRGRLSSTVVKRPCHEPHHPQIVRSQGSRRLMRIRRRRIFPVDGMAYGLQQVSCSFTDSCVSHGRDGAAPRPLSINLGPQASKIVHSTRLYKPS